MAAVENAEFWREFIAMYKELPELWQVKNDKFKKKSMKEKACQNLLRKLREIQPYATESTLKRKLSILKDSYRRELTRVRRSELIAKNPEDVYKPRLQFFQELSFLSEQDLNAGETLTETETEEEEKVIVSSTYNVHNERAESENENKPIAESVAVNAFPASKKSQSRANNERNKNNFSTNYNPSVDRSFMDSMHEKNKILAKHVLTSKQYTGALDDANVFSATWAALFRKLDPDQQMFANKAIMDVLYQGQLCRLDENCVTKSNEGSALSLHSSIHDLKTRDYTWKN